MFAETNPLVLLLFFVLGLLAGAQAVVVIHRDKARQTLFRGPARCPDCGAPAPFAQRLPVVSYLRGKGLRKGCGDRVRRRDPIVELITGLVWLLITARLGISWVLPAFLLYSTTLITVSAVDFDERRIPNKILGPSAVAGAILLVVAALAEGRPGLIVRMVVGAAAYALPMLVLGLITPGAMGMGDVKLAGYIGLHLAWFSYVHILVGAFLAFFVGALAGVILIALRKKGRKDTVPFGPSMAIGGILPIFLGAVSLLQV